MCHWFIVESDVSQGLACVSLQVLHFRIEWSVVRTKYRAIHKEVITSRSLETVDTHMTVQVCVQLDVI
jgi:hypothetical protein